MSAELINKAAVTQFITEVFGRFSGERVPALLRATFRDPIRLPGMLIARVRGEKIAECWWEEDRLAMLAQFRAA